MKASTDLLRAIGISLARNIVDQDDLCPEAKLWRCVILKMRLLLTLIVKTH